MTTSFTGGAGAASSALLAKKTGPARKIGSHIHTTLRIDDNLHYPPQFFIISPANSAQQPVSPHNLELFENHRLDSRARFEHDGLANI
jgi:hypothetical protein